MTVSIFNILEYPIEPCEFCGTGIDIDVPETYTFTPIEGVICSNCEERQRAFEDATEVYEELVVI